MHYTELQYIHQIMCLTSACLQRIARLIAQTIYFVSPCISQTKNRKNTQNHKYMVQIFAYLLLHIVKQYVFETIQHNCQQYPCNFPIPLFVFNTIQASVALFTQINIMAELLFFLTICFCQQISAELKCSWYSKFPLRM